MREAFNSALKDAMRDQDKRRMATLRLITAAIKDRDIAARGEGKERISDDEILGVLAKMIKQREESAKIYEEAGRLELAEQEREEIVIIRTFLPKQLGEAEVKAACAAVVAEIGASGLRDMGRAMAELKARYAGQMDFAKAGAIVKELLK
ncbi:MAG TPA: GatB/YqeY domain-containing protein [Hyphomicrobiales bacterium]|nr:GatB/YqeY domain-containing protein [Kaistiaceae bacterium]HQF31759.1 GatB/YqeY domain-containing protein [Hyphomicrobiales bacterium]